MKNCVGQDKKCSNFKHISYEAQTLEEVCGLFQQWRGKKRKVASSHSEHGIIFHYVNLLGEYPQMKDTQFIML
jgi:hypothetical protein